MKHFFHQRKAKSDGLLRDVLSAFNEADVTEQLKIIYDATDIIHDKRLPTADDELEDCFTNKSAYAYLFTESFDAKHDKMRLKYKALLSLWRYAEKLGDKLDSDVEWKLFHLTRGNLCNRLSQYFYDQQDFEQSEIWGDRAIEIIWHGINQNKEDDVYLRLLQLNLSVYYIDYSRRNQRSNYVSAELELTKLLKSLTGLKEIEIDEIDSEKPIDNEELLDVKLAVKRQNSLIKLEAMYDSIAISRRRFHNTEACKASSDFEKYVENLTEEETHLDKYDLQRYRLLAKLGVARVYRDMHDAKLYKEAIKLAIAANKLSDSTEVNIDALIIISSVLRKALKFSPETIDDIISEVTALFSQGLDGLFEKLYKLAEFRHSYSISELIKWYCMGMHPGLVQRKIAKEPHFPTKEQIDKCLTWLEESASSENTENTENTENADNANSSRQKGSSDHNSNHNSEHQSFLQSNQQCNNARSKNIQLEFLKGFLLFNNSQYTQARDLFINLIKQKEADYIRLGTIGLKVRYLLANTYMSLGQFSRAKSILQEIYDALNEARAYRDEPETDAESDLRTIIDLIYCHMRQGNYDKAYEMYCNYYRDTTGKEAPIQIDKNFLNGVRRSRRVAGINNLISCCMFATNEVGKIQEYLQTAQDAFKYLLEYCKEENFNKNPEINLLRGYFVLLTRYDPLNSIINTDNGSNSNKSTISSISHLDTVQTRANKETRASADKNEEDAALELAHEYFKLACGYQYGFSPIYHLTLDGKEPDRAYFSNHAVYISAYLISLIRLAEKQSAEKQRQSINTVANVANVTTAVTVSNVTSKDYEAEIKQFLLGMPRRYEITLNAAIALAEWLLEHENKKKNAEKDGNTQLLRSFCFTTIYEERGARPFNLLRKSKAFRLLASEQRGDIMVRLLCFYKYVKELKEECTYYHNNTTKTKTQQIVHYTTLETLKHLLQNGARFRLSNCGYMNDVFEGREFLKCMEKIATDRVTDRIANRNAKHVINEKDLNKDEDSINVAYDNSHEVHKEDILLADAENGLFEKYFPHLERSEKDMRPSGSNVYIGSLTVKEDSFPLWNIYSRNESGCNIEFGEDFFDISGKPYTQSILSEYLPFRYTEDDYPLYVVQYIGKEFYSRLSKLATSNMRDTRDMWNCSQDYSQDYSQESHLKHLQDCKTESIHYDRLEYLLNEIYWQWVKFEHYINCSFDSTKSSIAQELRQFVADRLNEVRFLFKSSDYEFEGEVRLIHTTEDSKVDYGFDVPRVYVDLDREIEGLTVRLGSRIDDAIVDQLVTWLKHSERVETVKLAERNRYVSGSVMGRKKKESAMDD